MYEVYLVLSMTQCRGRRGAPHPVVATQPRVLELAVPETDCSMSHPSTKSGQKSSHICITFMQLKIVNIYIKGIYRA